MPPNTDFRTELDRVEARLESKIDAAVERAIGEIRAVEGRLETKVGAAAEKAVGVELKLVGHETRLEALIKKAAELVTQLEFQPVKKLVYSGAGIVLATVLAALISKVVMK